MANEQEHIANGDGGEAMALDGDKEEEKAPIVKKPPEEDKEIET